MLFSNMPPLEEAKILCSELATRKTSKKGNPLRLALYDISRAHFYGKAQRKIYVTLPPEDDEPGKCAILLKTMYGTQDASHVWQGINESTCKTRIPAGKGMDQYFHPR